MAQENENSGAYTRLGKGLDSKWEREGGRSGNGPGEGGWRLTVHLHQQMYLDGDGSVSYYKCYYIRII